MASSDEPRLSPLQGEHPGKGAQMFLFLIALLPHWTAGEGKEKMCTVRCQSTCEDSILSDTARLSGTTNYGQSYSVGQTPGGTVR